MMKQLLTSLPGHPLIVCLSRENGSMLESEAAIHAAPSSIPEADVLCMRSGNQEKGRRERV